MYTARTSSLIEPADVDRLDHRPVEARDRDDDPLLAPRLAADEVRPDGELRRCEAAYWWWMNSIIPTSSGTRITTR